ncbi:MAG: ribonuclease III [Rickettsiales bacterium]
MAAAGTYAALEAVLGYQFNDASRLTMALTHRSLSREGRDASNQRLEFLGDAVLGLAIAEMLYGLFPYEPEGDLSKRLVSLVNGEQLAMIGQKLELGSYLQLSSGEEEQGGRENPSNLEDALEALLGAIYLDAGLPAVKSVIVKFWEPYARALTAPPKDAKTALQEWAQGRGLALPEYILISSDGPSHAPLFVIEVRVEGVAPARAEAGVKKVAERLAAEKILANLA